MRYSKPTGFEIGCVRDCTLGKLKKHAGIDEVQLPRDGNIDVAEIDDGAGPKQNVVPTSRSLKASATP